MTISMTVQALQKELKNVLAQMLPGEMLTVLDDNGTPQAIVVRMQVKENQAREDRKMNLWQELDIENKLIQILQDVPEAYQEHHLGRPFLTAYQIAIEYAKRHPADVKQLGFPIGGAGTGQRNSLAQYLAAGLSREIKAKQLTHVEGGFLSNQYLKDISFDVDGETIHSSLTGSGFPLSMFRWQG